MAPQRNISSALDAFQQPDVPIDQGTYTGMPLSQTEGIENIIGSRFSNSMASEDFAKWLESAAEILLPLYTDLTGKQLQADADGNMRWVQIGKAKCTDACAEFIIMRLRNMLNPNTFMSQFTDDDIRRFCILQSDTFVCTLAKMSEDWELDSYMQEEILEIFRFHLFAGMRRALDASEKRLFMIIQRSNEMSGMPYGQMPMQQQPGGITNSILGMFRR